MSHVRRAIHSAVRELAPEMTSVLRRSVAVPSVTGEERRIADHYMERLSGWGWSPQRRPLSVGPGVDGSELGEGRDCITVDFGPPDLPILILNGHLDVVPPGKLEDWHVDPFSGDLRDGVVFGRGAVDMKGGITAGLWALRALESAGVDLGVGVSLQLVVGEETTGVGTRSLLGDLDNRSTLGALVLEPTDNKIVAVNTGLQFFTVHVGGAAAHTSAPWKGVDAFEKLLMVRAALIDVAGRRSRNYTHELFAGLPTAMPFAIGMVRAGEYRASVPAAASMSGRFGLAPGESIKAVRDEYLEAIADASGRDVWLSDHPPVVQWDNDGLVGWETDETTALMGALSAAGRHVLGSVDTVGFTAGSDAAWFGGLGIPTAVFGPGDVSLAHAPNEAIEVASVEAAAEIIALTLAGLP